MTDLQRGWKREPQNENPNLGWALLTRLGRRETAITVAALIGTAILGGLMGGCGSGHVANAIYTISPSQLSGATRVISTQTTTFSGYVANTSQTARYYVEKPPSEAPFDPSAPVSSANPMRGEIDHFTGVYTAPSVVWTSANNTQQSTDIVAVISSDQQAQIQKLVAQLGSTTVVPDNTITFNYPGTDVNLLRADVAANRLEDAYSRLVATIPSREKANVSFSIYYQTVFNPTSVTASIRTTTALAPYVAVLGDPNSTATQNKHVTWTIVNPELGAGGKVDPATGVYTAPNTALPSAAGTRASYDVIQATSIVQNVDGSVSSTIQVNTISGVVGIGVTAQ